MARWMELVPLDDLLLRPAERNPRKHDMDGLRASVDRFGYVEAVTLDERTGRIVAGHGRVQDLAGRREEGEEPPEGVERSDDGAWLVPVQRGWASRSEGDAEAYLLASNRISEGLWEPDALAEMFADYANEPEWLLGTGYGQDEVDTMLAPKPDEPELEAVSFLARVGPDEPERVALTFDLLAEDRTVVTATLEWVRAQMSLESAEEALVTLCRSVQMS